MDEQSIATLRRQLRFRAWHRGTREMDLMLGRFADAYVATLPLDLLLSFAKLLEASDVDLYDWITGRDRFPADANSKLTDLLRRI